MSTARTQVVESVARAPQLRTRAVDKVFRNNGQDTNYQPHEHIYTYIHIYKWMIYIYMNHKDDIYTNHKDSKRMIKIL